jgi:hypothetical protein
MASGFGQRDLGRGLWTLGTPNMVMPREQGQGFSRSSEVRTCFTTEE